MTAGLTNICSTNVPKTTPQPVDLKKKTTKSGPSSLRQILPIALCLFTFATVLSILVIYMDTTEIKHKQFRLNMTRDLDFVGVEQFDAKLISFIRNFHLRKYPMSILKKENPQHIHINETENHILTPEIAEYISRLVGGKKNGSFLQSMTARSYAVDLGPWLSENLDWDGLIVEPDLKSYFAYRRNAVNLSKIQVTHACLSPNDYLKEITLHHEENKDVKITAIDEKEPEWFYSRIKCFPLYSILSAIYRTNIDLVSLGCQGSELKILHTIPFDKVRIQLISIHLLGNEDLDGEYFEEITSFLEEKSYRLVKTWPNNYIFKLRRVTVPFLP